MINCSTSYWSDDIGWQNVSTNGMGTIGYTPPNIDLIGMEGIRFTEQYGTDSYGHLTQKMSWLFEPISGLIEDHLKTFVKYPPVGAEHGLIYLTLSQSSCRG